MTVPEIVPHASTEQLGAGRSPLDRRGVAAVGRRREEAHPCCANTVHRASTFAPPLLTRSAWIIAFRVSRKDGSLGASPGQRRESFHHGRAEDVAELPHRLRPDLAVLVDLRERDDPAHVAERVAAGARAEPEVRAVRRARSHQTVDRLCPDPRSGGRVLASTTSLGEVGPSTTKPSFSSESSPYQSPHASCIAPAWKPTLASVPSGKVFSRATSPCVYRG